MCAKQMSYQQSCMHPLESPGLPPREGLHPVLVNEGVLSLHSFFGVFCTSIYLLSIHLLTL